MDQFQRVGLLGVLAGVVPDALRFGWDVVTADTALAGAALVIERVDARSGRVKIGGEIWSARVRNPETEFAAGRELIVISIDGATEIVDAPNSEPATGSVGE